MLLSLLSAPSGSFTTYRDASAVSKRTLSDRLIFEVPKCSKNPNFPGICPGPHVEEPTGRAYRYIAPGPNWWRGDSLPLPNNPTPVLGKGLAYKFYGYQGMTITKLSTINMIITLLIHITQ